MSKAARTGFLWAFLALVADQASKLFLLFIYELPMRYPITLGPFFELTVEWNRGVSYGLFQQDGDLGRWFLIGVSILAVIFMSVWMMRIQTRFLAASIGLIIGGAIGNGIDRVAYGAVFDFAYIHVGSFSWYVFNVADALIVFGVMGLLYDSFFLEKKRLQNK